MLFFIIILAVFAFSKPIFMLINGAEGMGVRAIDYAEVVCHGLPHDVMVASYLSIPVCIGMTFASFCPSPCPPRMYRFFAVGYNIYIGIVSVLISTVIIADTCLYGFWDIKLDTTVLGYLDSISGITQSVSTGYIFILLIVFALFSTSLYVLLYFARPDRLMPKGRAFELQFGGFKFVSLRFVSLGHKHKDSTSGQRLRPLPYLVAGIGFFVLSQGYLFDRKPDIGMVYYSPRQILNHGAVNPLYSLCYSVLHQGAKNPSAHYFSDSECQRIFEGMQYDNTSDIAPTDSLLRLRRPNVLVIVLEGCGAQFVEALDGAKGVTPNINRLCKGDSLQSVVFTQCYANSFRTDRGLVSILSGYPAYPDMSVMRLPTCRRSLPGIAASLSSQGYDTQVLYGGDITFTDMDRYFENTGYHQILSDKDFSPQACRTHAWGVTDSITFSKLKEQISAYPTDRPWHTMFLTLASHEPWGVPYTALRRRGKIANAFAYMDHCLGDFLQAFSQTPQWDKTLVVLIADHGVTWPTGMSEANIQKYHIPMIWTGGAVRRSRRIDLICNQSDLPATLLGQLGIEHSAFRFSRDVLSQTYTHPCAQHSWSEGFGIIDNTGATIIDLMTQKALTDTPSPSAERAKYARAYLQTAYKQLSDDTKK